MVLVPSSWNVKRGLHLDIWHSSAQSFLTVQSSSRGKEAKEGIEITHRTEQNAAACARGISTEIVAQQSDNVIRSLKKKPQRSLSSAALALHFCVCVLLNMTLG